ncbi:MAG: fimbrillin family protein [Bacteroidaceae bacterium]|nr:fimbrillin family protein [Bacteroidaceae bacterium]
MKHTSIFPLLAIGMCLVASCSNESKELKSVVSEDCITEVVMGVDNFVFGSDTRTSIAPSGEFTWTKGDKIGVWPTMSADDEGIASQVLFQAAGGNSNYVKFTGSGWGLVPNRQYFAYYPYSADATAQKVVAAYTNKVNQKTNNSTAHLAVNDFMYTNATTPDAGNTADFQFHHFGSLMKINITVPDGGNTGKFKTVIITAPEPLFPNEIEYNPTALEPVPAVKSYFENQTITLGADGAGFAPDKNNVITVYLLIGETDLSDKTLKVAAYDGRNAFIGSFTGKKQQSGRGCSYALELTRTNPENTADLGLPSGKYWATSNLTVNGLAEKETDFGDYYGWGELEPYYSSLKVNGEGDVTVTWKEGYEEGYSQSVYNLNTERGSYTSSSDKLAPTDDAAYVKLGGNWRMPSLAELKELGQYCTLSSATLNGVKGVAFTSKINGNSIFLPSNGYMNGKTIKGYTSSSPGSRFWVSDCVSETTATQQYCAESSPSLNYDQPKDKWRGTPIRPIYVPGAE